uniref:Uncharacterized protein n=1 Tax=Heterorhabditis bacteriophora TaxID=37862 RepID=A0A1I7W6C6_HETBA
MNSMQRNEMNRETVSNSSLKELRQIQTSAQIPPGVMLGMSSAPTIHSTKLIMLDPPPCECEQKTILNNSEHQLPATCRSLWGAVDEKRAEDSEKETRVLGSYTPDKICIAVRHTGILLST